MDGRGAETVAKPVIVSVILPIHNGVQWLDGCLESILAQTLLDPSAEAPHLELSAFDDGSTDATWEALKNWAPRLRERNVQVTLGRSGSTSGGGCGFAKNRAVAQSHGAWLCFHDVDDLMQPHRIARQLAAAREWPDAIVGARVLREPQGSTERYTSWANNMTPDQLYLHRFRECTLLMPTWFISREAFYTTGGFREEKCEDLLFLQAHVLRGGTLHRVDETLVGYRYHAQAVSQGTPRQLLLRHRALAIEEAVLAGWESFTIWGAGRDGRAFFKALSEASKRKVAAFCDVDPQKIGRDYHYFEYRVPIVHFTQARPPIVTCVALDRTGGAFEANLASLQLAEGKDFYHFC